MISKIRYPFFLLLVVFIFFSCKKSDSGPGAPPAPPVPVTTVTSISPASGPSATLDTIVGTNFSAKDSVYFNGKCASVVSASATQLVVKVPPMAGTGKVTINDSTGLATTGPVFTFTGNTYVVSTFAGSGNEGSAEGTGTAADFHYPWSIAIDHNDNLYVVDYGNNKIRKITPAGVVTTLAGSGTPGSANGTGAAASFNTLNGIAVDADGNVYVADDGSNSIRKITPPGVVSTLAGSGSAGSTDATGIAASFDYPADVAVDGSGNVFVADQNNYKIRKITPSGIVNTFAGNGTSVSLDGKGTAAGFSGLSGIFFNAGNLYVTDNNSIRKITPDVTVTTIAGKSDSYGFQDGTGLSALFWGTNSITVDANGFMYVADAGNEVIRQISPEGIVTLLAGAVQVGGADDGPALKARFGDPSSVAVDSHGNIFVADQTGHTIRKLTPQ
jgi:serine/threonine protein kinase, bacterial